MPQLQVLPWLRPQRDYLGCIDRVDASAAGWDEQGFTCSRPQYYPVGPVFYKTAPTRYGRLGGNLSAPPLQAYHAFRLGQGTGKDHGRYFLLAELRYENGERLEEGAVGEYAGTGHGICAAYRGKGVGRAFFKELMKRGLWTPEALGYSPQGRATAISAHRSLIHDALLTDLVIPPHVLADYPTLMQPPHPTDASHRPNTPLSRPHQKF